MRDILLSLLIVVIGYLLGCFSTGITISKAQGVDIRSKGSKNTGASNVLRVLGVKSGVATFLGDILKASLAVWIGYFILPGKTFGIERYGMMLGGFAAIIGHNWPVFYGFKGGKGVACSAAVIFFSSIISSHSGCIQVRAVPLSVFVFVVALRANHCGIVAT